MAKGTLTIRILGDTKDFEQKVKGIGDKMTSVGKSMTVGVTLPLAAAGVAAFKLASDVSESMSQVGVVFGNESDKIISASESMNDAFAQGDFLAYAGNLGDVAQGLGIAKDQSDDLALSVLGLSQDLSSFKNVPVDQAVGAITSALAGEREALKSLGIVINDEMVKQKAMTMGLYDGTGALDSAAQAQATMALITEKSANAIGDFERTQDGAANTTKTLMSNAKDLAAQLGTNLLPIGTQILGWANQMVTWFGNLSPAAQKVIVVIGGLVAAIGPGLIVFGKMASSVTSIAGLFGEGGALTKAFTHIGKAWTALSKLFMANPWMLLIAAVIALVALIIANWDKIKAFLQKTWDWIKKTAGAVWEWLKDIFAKGLEFVKNLFLNWTLIGIIIKNWDKIKEGVSNLWTWLKDTWQGIIDWFKSIPERIGRGFAVLKNLLMAPFKAAFNAIARLWNNSIGKLSFRAPSWVPGIGGKGFSMPKLPILHSGGIVPGLPGQDVLAILEAGEQVIPAGASGSGDIYVVFNGPVLGTEAELAKNIRDELVKLQRRGGRLGFTG